MAREPALPLNGPWYAERPIGEGRIANVHIKTETAHGKTTVVVLAVSFALPRDNQDENAATIKMRKPRRLAAL